MFGQPIRIQINLELHKNTFNSNTNRGGVAKIPIYYPYYRFNSNPDNPAALSWGGVLDLQQQFEPDKIRMVFNPKP